MMTKAEFLTLYGDIEVAFESYYKYSFSFKGTTPEGYTILVSVGGSAEDIYRLEVGTEKKSIKTLDPSSGDVYVSNNNIPIHSFYDY